MSTPITGSCLCGAVSYQATPVPEMAAKCYCTDCRKSGGGGHGAHQGAVKTTAEIRGKLSTFCHTADSGSTITKAFCPVCGSQVYSLNSNQPELIFIRASTLDDVERFRPNFQVYVSRAPSWEKVAGDVPQFDEMPPVPPVPT